MLNYLTKYVYYVKSYRLYLPQMPINPRDLRTLNYNQDDFENLQQGYS